jgi:hypothetical protein
VFQCLEGERRTRADADQRSFALSKRRSVVLNFRAILRLANSFCDGPRLSLRGPNLWLAAAMVCRFESAAGSLPDGGDCWSVAHCVVYPVFLCHADVVLYFHTRNLIQEIPHCLLSCLNLVGHRSLLAYSKVERKESAAADDDPPLSSWKIALKVLQKPQEWQENTANLPYKVVIDEARLINHIGNIDAVHHPVFAATSGVLSISKTVPQLWHIKEEFHFCIPGE